MGIVRRGEVGLPINIWQAQDTFLQAPACAVMDRKYDYDLGLFSRGCKRSPSGFIRSNWCNEAKVEQLLGAGKLHGCTGLRFKRLYFSDDINDLRVCRRIVEISLSACGFLWFVPTIREEIEAEQGTHHAREVSTVWKRLVYASVRSDSHRPSISGGI
ncbi:MAG: hypothetical protein ACREEJ_21175, partial [Ensifer adhaerens]